MKHYFLFFATVLFFTTSDLSAQCSFTTAIAVNGPTTGCGTFTLSIPPVNGIWTQKTGLNNARANSTSFSIGNKGYVCAGENSIPPYVMDDLWEYDPAGNTWTQKASFPGGARYGTFGFSIGAKGYVGAGNNGSSYLNDFYEYDPAGNSWTPKANFGGFGRESATGFSIGTMGYAGTGYGSLGSSYYNDFWQYDPVNDIWTSKAAFPGTGRKYSVSFSIGTKGYMGTGGGTNDFYEYDPSTDAWTQKANFAGGLSSGLVAFTINNYGFVGIGGTLFNNTNGLWRFDPAANSWKQETSFPGASRQNAVGFTIGNKGYVGTGDGSGYYSDLWEYVPGSDISWSTGSTLQAINVTTSGSYSVSVTDVFGCVAIASQSISISPNPTIAVFGDTRISCSGAMDTLIASGATSYTWSQNAGSVNSASVVISPTSSTIYTVSATNGTCTSDFTVNVNAYVLPASSITIVGSPTICGSAITLSTSTVVLDNWTQRSSLNKARSLAVSFSIGNKGYVGTGQNNSYTYLNDFWEFDPPTNTWTQKANFPGTARRGGIGFSIGNKGYAGGGQDMSIGKSDFFEYDPSSNTWSSKASIPDMIYFGVSFSIGTKGYAGTGYNSIGTSHDFYEYNSLTDSWTQKAGFPDYRLFAIGMSIGGKGYVGTGDSLSMGGSNDFFEYDPTLDTWTQKASLSVHITSAAAFTLGNYGYIVGSSVWQYDQANDNWSQMQSLGGSSRIYATGFSVADKGYVCGGINNIGQSYNDLREYQPATIINWSNGVNTLANIVTNSGTYTLTLTNVFGCSDTSSKTVSITNIPAVAVSGSAAICIGTTLSLTATGANSYTWGASAGSSMNTTIFDTPTITTSYYVLGAIGNCTAAATKTVTVNALPVVSAHTSSSSVCQSFNVVLSGAGATSYSWTGGVANNVAFAPASTDNYTVTGTDNHGCINTAAISVTVLPSPTVTVNSGTICSGDSFTLVPAGGVTYTYSGGSSVVAPGSTTMYTVTGFNNAGCPNPLPAISSVTVNPLPVISISNASLCAGDSYTITPTGATNYTYSNGSPVVTPAATSSYTITGSNVFGCLSATPAIITLSVNPLPSVTVSNGTVCSGQSFTIVPAGAASYTYSGSNNVVTPSVTLTYSVDGISAAGCITETTVTVFVQPLPDVSITGPTISCNGDNAILTASGANSFSWSDNSTGQNITVTTTATTSYSVAGSDINGCKGRAVITVSVSDCTDLAENGMINETSVRVYPNPGSGLVTIESTNLPKDAVAELYDGPGQLILSRNIIDNGSDLDFTSASNGLYTLRVKSKDKIVVIVKLVKQ